VSIHRTITQYSLPSNWHHPSELPPSQTQSSVDLSSWMLKGSIMTSGLNSKMIPFLQDTSTISQIPSGPSILMVYYTTSDTSMFQILAIFDLCSPGLTQPSPLQVILLRQRPFIKSACNTFGLDFQYMSRTTANHVPSVPVPNCAPQTLRTPQTASNSDKALEFDLYGFHREAPSIFQLQLNSSHC